VSNQQFWAQYLGYPSITKPGKNVPAPLRTFQLETRMIVSSNVTTFSAALQRTLTRSDGAPLNFAISQNFPRLFQ
jgi:hypothetical protein